METVGSSVALDSVQAPVNEEMYMLSSVWPCEVTVCIHASVKHPVGAGEMMAQWLRSDSSSRQLGLGSQHSRGRCVNSEPSVTAVPGDPMFLSALLEHCVHIELRRLPGTKQPHK